MKIRIPRSSARYEARNYARLIPYSGLSQAFLSGTQFKCGSEHEETDLWPSSHYPKIPLLLEYAGNDHSGSGHNRSRDIFVLWRYLPDQHKWEQITRTFSHGSEWFHHLKPIVERELVRPEIDHSGEARATAGRWAALIAGDLAALTPEGKEHAVADHYNEVASLFERYVIDRAAIYDGADTPPAEVLESAGEIERMPAGRAFTSVEGLEGPEPSGSVGDVGRISPGRALGLDPPGEDAASGVAG